MEIAKTRADVRTFLASTRREGQTIGFVPTMGALHAGHEALIRRCREENDVTVVSIFVNPLQFGPREDFAAYPRDLEHDREICERLGVDLIFAPEAEDMYPPDFSTFVTVEKLTEGLCGRFRPGHFRGVTTVVCKLLNIVQPQRAYFGQKDYQQWLVIRRMTRDLDMPVEIIPVPTVREPDGLACSSRNAYLSPEERAVAPRLYEALQAGAAVAAAGGSGAEAIAAARAALEQEPRFTIQYIEAVDPETLADKTAAGPPFVLAAAVFLGRTRLIDNIIVTGSETAAGIKQTQGEKK